MTSVSGQTLSLKSYGSLPESLFSSQLKFLKVESHSLCLSLFVHQTTSQLLDSICSGFLSFPRFSLSFLFFFAGGEAIVQIWLFPLSRGLLILCIKQFSSQQGLWGREAHGWYIQYRNIWQTERRLVTIHRGLKNLNWNGNTSQLWSQASENLWGPRTGRS